MREPLECAWNDRMVRRQQQQQQQPFTTTARLERDTGIRTFTIPRTNNNNDNNQDEEEEDEIRHLHATTRAMANVLLLTGGSVPNHNNNHNNNNKKMSNSSQSSSVSSSPDDNDSVSYDSYATFRRALSQAITLLESHAPTPQAQGTALLLYLQQQQQQHQQHQYKPQLNRQVLRIGIAGPPGAGKSTLIEALGLHVLSSSLSSSSDETLNPAGTSTHSSSSSSSLSFLQLAVLCVDPSSVVSGGSILGDVTRMPQLARHPAVLVRPVPSSAGTLGGLAGSKTYDTVQLLTTVLESQAQLQQQQAQQQQQQQQQAHRLEDHVNTEEGPDSIKTTDGSSDSSTSNNTTTSSVVPPPPVLLIETVGVGQSEVHVSQVSDVTLLLIPPGGGDALQGAKKGILEVADVVCVTKADGALESVAQTTAADYQAALSVSSQLSSSSCHHHSSPRVRTVSAHTGQGLADLWTALCQVAAHRQRSGAWETRRRAQNDYWMWHALGAQVQQHVQTTLLPPQQQQNDKNDNDDPPLPARVAATRLFQTVFGGTTNDDDDKTGSTTKKKPPSS